MLYVTKKPRRHAGRKDRRAHVVTEALMDALDKNALWYDYGIIPDVMVSG